MKKELMEKRNDLIAEMEGLVNVAETETRALNEAELARVEAIKTEISNIDATAKAEENLRSFEKVEEKIEKREVEEIMETREILNRELKDIFEQRTLNTTANDKGGYVVNEELVKDIIKALKDRSNVYAFFNGTSLKGEVKIPKKTASGQAIWVDENPNTDPASSTPSLATIALGQHRLYREGAITQQMLNVQELDLSAFLKEDIAESMEDAIEAAILTGSGSKQPTGLIGGIATAKKVNVAAKGKITVAELKKCKAKLKKSGWARAKWFMNSSTLLELDLLEDANKRPLLQPDLTNATGYKLLGIDVEVTDAMPELSTASACVIVLACPEAYHTNTQKSLALYTYTDSTYTKRGLVGYGADLYMDGKVKNDDVLAGIFNLA